MTNFNYEMPDKLGKTPDFDLLTTLWKHSGNGKVYQIVGFTWLGADDLWGFRMVSRTDGGAVDISRPLDHLHGTRANGEQRYSPV